MLLHDVPGGFVVDGHRLESLETFSVVLFAAETTYFYLCPE